MRELIKLKEKDLLFFDIETARVVPELTPDSPLYNSWEYKCNKTGEKTQEEVLESFKVEAGLYPEFSKVICIVVGKIFKGEIHTKILNDKDEVKLLSDFNDVIEKNSSSRLVGFVNISFDSPFVFKRMLINGITPHDKLDSSGLKPWEVEEVDLAMSWKGNSFNRASLINIATAFGLPSPKDDIGGADVGRVYWEEGDTGLERISTYCEKDVVTTINVFKKMRLEDPLPISRSEIKEEVKPMLMGLFKGASFTSNTKESIIEYVQGLNQSDRDMAFTILNSVVSSAKGKKTKITKAILSRMKKDINGK